MERRSNRRGEILGIPKSTWATGTIGAIVWIFSVGFAYNSVLSSVGTLNDKDKLHDRKFLIQKAELDKSEKRVLDRIDDTNDNVTNLRKDVRQTMLFLMDKNK